MWLQQSLKVRPRIASRYLIGRIVTSSNVSSPFPSCSLNDTNDT
jgi:hypothetical protein